MKKGKNIFLVFFVVVKDPLKLNLTRSRGSILILLRKLEHWCMQNPELVPLFFSFLHKLIVVDMPFVMVLFVIVHKNCCGITQILIFEEKTSKGNI